MILLHNVVLFQSLILPVYVYSVTRMLVTSLCVATRVQNGMCMDQDILFLGTGKSFKVHFGEGLFW